MTPEEPTQRHSLDRLPRHIARTVGPDAQEREMTTEEHVPLT